MNKVVKVVLKTIEYLIVISVVVLAFLLIGIRIFNFKIYTVLSGSMKPSIQVGSLIYVKEIEEDDIKIGDVITFKLTENTTATHRINDITIEDGQKYFHTKGDANETEDEKLLEYSNIIGKEIFTIPLLGYLSTFIQTPPGSYITIAIGVLLIAILYVIDYITEDKKELKNEKKDTNNS